MGAFGREHRAGGLTGAPTGAAGRARAHGSDGRRPACRSNGADPVSARARASPCVRSPLCTWQRCRAGVRPGDVAGRPGHPVADCAVGHGVGPVHHGLGPGADGGDLPSPSVGLHVLSHVVAAHDAAASLVERGDDEVDPKSWQRRPIGGWTCRRRVRRVPDGRGCGDRGDPVRHPARGQFHGDHQGLRPHRRGGGTVQLGRDAGQADGDRRRPVFGADQRGEGARTPQGARGGERISTARWMVRRSSCAGTRSPAC